MWEQELRAGERVTSYLCLLSTQQTSTGQIHCLFLEQLQLHVICSNLLNVVMLVLSHRCSEVLKNKRQKKPTHNKWGLILSYSTDLASWLLCKHRKATGALYHSCFLMTYAILLVLSLGNNSRGMIMAAQQQLKCYCVFPRSTYLWTAQNWPRLSLYLL